MLLFAFIHGEELEGGLGFQTCDEQMIATAPVRGRVCCVLQHACLPMGGHTSLLVSRPVWYARSSKLSLSLPLLQEALRYQWSVGTMSFSQHVWYAVT